MNSKKNTNAIRRYSNTSVYYADNNSSSDYITNPIKSVNTNAFSMFTKNLSYFKTKYQHKHYDKCNMPYKISMDNHGNAYIKWCNIHDVTISDSELNANMRIVLMALDIMSERAIKLTCNSVRDFILSEIPYFYFNGIDLPLLIKEYKKLHDIKHRTDRECLVFRPKKKSTISPYAKRLGTVVK